MLIRSKYGHRLGRQGFETTFSVPASNRFGKDQIKLLVSRSVGRRHLSNFRTAGPHHPFRQTLKRHNAVVQLVDVLYVANSERPRRLHLPVMLR